MKKRVIGMGAALAAVALCALHVTAQVPVKPYYYDSNH